MPSDIVQAYTSYIESLHRAGESPEAIQARLDERLGEEPGVSDDEKEALRRYVLEFHRRSEEQSDLQRELTKTRETDVDGIRQTLREHAHFYPAVAVSLFGFLVCGLILGVMAGSSGNLLTLVWLLPAGVMARLVRSLGQCPDGPIRLVHTLACLLGFTVYATVGQVIYESRMAELSPLAFETGEYLILGIAGYISAGPLGLLVLLGTLMWSYRFSATGIGVEQVARAKQLQATVLPDLGPTRQGDSPY